MFKRTKFGFGFLIGTVISFSIAHADPSHCVGIQNQAARAACIARESGNKGYCTSIESSDRRTACRARTDDFQGRPSGARPQTWDPFRSR